MGLFDQVLYCPECRKVMTGRMEECDHCHSDLMILSGSVKKWESLTPSEKSREMSRAQQQHEAAREKESVLESAENEKEKSRVLLDQKVVTTETIPMKTLLSAMGTVFAAEIFTAENLDDEDLYAEQADEIEEAFFRAKMKLLKKAEAREATGVVGLKTQLVRSDDGDSLILTLTGTAVKAV